MSRAPVKTTTQKHTVHFYPSYYFRAKEQDPIIDQMQTIMEKEGHKPGRIHELTGLSTSTLHNWFVKRKVRRPQYSSVAAFIRGHGYDLALIKTSHKANGNWTAEAPRILTNYRG